ncbi:MULTISPECIES: (d)CMP kinase [Hyphobacterium]|uniref:Cytidylate kinase n=1 Tax=Hyphobacterium vulgare TaxID=1736751 RepID=A0ABV6ZXP6_9PROT
MIIAVDGTLASGKGTIAKALAKAFGLAHLDTGALYRATGVAVVEAGGDPTDPDAAEHAARTLDVEAIDEAKIRTAEAGLNASIVAAQPRVRQALFELQRGFAARPGGAVLDGRDIGTVICPDADVKLYVDADPSVRAERRWKELTAKGETVALATIAKQLAERDARDSGRADAPMRAADDAVLLDTSQLSIDAAVSAAIRIVSDKTGTQPGI